MELVLSKQSIFWFLKHKTFMTCDWISIGEHPVVAAQAPVSNLAATGGLAACEPCLWLKVWSGKQGSTDHRFSMITVLGIEGEGTVILCLFLFIPYFYSIMGI